MDDTAFLKNDRADEYFVRLRISGDISITIKADNLEEAKEKAAAMIEDEEFGLELDEADDIYVAYVSKERPLYLVNRDGKAMQVSFLKEGDQPRQPTEHGF